MDCSDYSCYEIPEDFKITLVDLAGFEGGVVTPAVKKRVEDIWQKLKKEKGEHLFNGKILSCIELKEKKHEMLAAFVEYKLFIAQSIDPSLAPLLKIDPVAVTGITCREDKILLGKRGDFVSQSPGAYEFVPSGGVDPSCIGENEMSKGTTVDFLQQLVAELGEETGIPKRRIKSLHPFGLIRDSSASFLDICIKIELRKEAALFEANSSEEYSEMHWLSKGRAQEFLTSGRYQVVPSSLMIIKQFQSFF